MKTLTTLILLIISVSLFGQKYCQNGDTIVRGTGIDTHNNLIRYQIEVQDSVIESGLIHCAEMWMFLETNKIGLLDVNKTYRLANLNLATVMLYTYNLSIVRKDRWELKND